MTEINCPSTRSSQTFCLFISGALYFLVLREDPFMVRCKEAGGSQGPFLFMTLIFFQLQSDLTAKPGYWPGPSSFYLYFSNVSRMAELTGPV